MRFEGVFGDVFFVFGRFGRARNKAEERNTAHPPRENLVFQGARPRRRRQQDEEFGFKKNNKTAFQIG